MQTIRFGGWGSLGQALCMFWVGMVSGTNPKHTRACLRLGWGMMACSTYAYPKHFVHLNYRSAMAECNMHVKLCCGYFNVHV